MRCRFSKVCREVDLVPIAYGNDICLPPVVLTELLSDPEAHRETEEAAAGFPLLPILDGYWERAGQCRRQLIQKGLKAALGDTLIGQSRMDHDVALITRDPDYRHFEKHCGLKPA